MQFAGYNEQDSLAAASQFITQAAVRETVAAGSGLALPPQGTINCSESNLIALIFALAHMHPALGVPLFRFLPLIIAFLYHPARREECRSSAGTGQ